MWNENKEMVCPRCGGLEGLAKSPGDKTVRPYKVDVGRGWESHCISCEIWFVDEEVWADDIGLHIETDSGHRAVWVHDRYVLEEHLSEGEKEERNENSN
jgi:hypothetical protein